MSGPIERPEFYEGQVLAAADLGATVDYARNQLARHERYLHDWGIAFGLALSLPSTAGASLTIGAGMAIDPTGREIVVDSDSPIDTQFTLSSKKPVDWFPVFLVGKDAPAPVASTLTGVCNTAQPSRVAERWDVEFGNPGDELRIADTPGPADVTSGPGGGSDDQSPARLLVGFVEYTQGTGITKAAATAPGNPVRPKYAGVQADDVRARGPRLTLETSGGQIGEPQLALDETNGGELDFRLVGQTSPLFNVDNQGNLTIAGRLTTGQPPPGAVLVESGVVSDGMMLPLPSGVTPALAQGGQVTLHVMLTMHPPGSFTPPTTTPTTWIATPLDCSFDPTTLTVSCLVQWVDVNNLTAPQLLPGTCDYVVAVTL